MNLTPDDNRSLGVLLIGQKSLSGRSLDRTEVTIQGFVSLYESTTNAKMLIIRVKEK